MRASSSSVNVYRLLRSRESQVMIKIGAHPQLLEKLVDQIYAAEMCESRCGEFRADISGS